MPSRKLKEFLDSKGIKYVSIRHSPAYTAQEIASKAHISGKDMAKTVMVKVDGKMAMAVLPAECKVDFDMLKEVLEAKEVELAGEVNFMELFPDCEIGAMPPFGNLYDMDVYVADAMVENEDIAFNAGSHSEIMIMSYMDFEDLVKPKIVHFTYHVMV